jgi:hypothetical protein
MRIWYIHPGYLPFEVLLREQAALQNYLSDLRGSVSSSPVTVSLSNSFLKIRHALVRAEVEYRNGLLHSAGSPLHNLTEINLPSNFDSAVVRQFQQLDLSKGREKSGSRLPVPQNVQQLWSQHKYSVMARPPETYKALGQKFAQDTSQEAFRQAAPVMTRKLYHSPPPGRLHNALQHMWGHVSRYSNEAIEDIDSPYPLIQRIQKLCKENEEPYLTTSTALTELRAWGSCEQTDTTRGG